LRRTVAHRCLTALIGTNFMKQLKRAIAGAALLALSGAASALTLPAATK